MFISYQATEGGGRHVCVCLTLGVFCISRWPILSRLRSVASSVSSVCVCVLGLFPPYSPRPPCLFLLPPLRETFFYPFPGSVGMDTASPPTPKILPPRFSAPLFVWIACSALMCWLISKPGPLHSHSISTYGLDFCLLLYLKPDSAHCLGNNAE